MVSTELQPMTDTSTQSAVRYEQDADGIVTLTLDDPTAGANTMNEIYRDSMRAAVDRLVAEKESVTGVVLTSAKKTFFAGGNLKKMIEATPDDAPALFAEVEGIKADLRRLETLGRPVVAADQRRRARRWARDRARLPPPDRLRRPAHRARPARGHPRPAARRRRRHPGRADARPDRRPDGRAAHRHPVQAGAGAGEGARRRARLRPRRAGPGREGVGPRAPRRRRGRRTAVGPGGLPDARRHARRPPSWRPSCRRSRPTCASRPRARTTRRRGRSCPPRSRARRSTSRPRPASSRATSPGSWSARTPRT